MILLSKIFQRYAAFEPSAMHETQKGQKEISQKKLNEKIDR
jgi:hypothetical protein